MIEPFPFIGLLLFSLAAGIVVTMISEETHSRRVGIIFSGFAMLIAFYMLYLGVTSGSINVSESYPYYIPTFGIQFLFQLTPVSFLLAFMATIVAFVTILAGNIDREEERIATSLILLFEFAAIGLFASSNLFLFFIFWDIGVIALFFMIYLLGSANRRRAAMKFIIYEIFASLLLLFGIILIYFYTPVHSFNINYIATNAYSIPGNMQTLIFLLFFVAFLTNMPVFPMHLWLPEAHTEASTQGSMLLSGILTKFGGYGMVLLFTMLPIGQAYSVYVAALATVSAFYISFMLMVQNDIKRIIAYTTIVEMSIILFGICAVNTVGTAGAAYAMLAHGFAIALLFLTAGSIKHIFAERDIRLLRGIVSNATSTAYVLLTGVLATTGIPLTAAFIGDILIFIGAVQAFSIYGAIPLVTIIMFGAYLYYVLNKSVFSAKEETSPVDYIGMPQKVGYAILLFFIFLFGLLPFVVLNFFNV